MTSIPFLSRTIHSGRKFQVGIAALATLVGLGGILGFLGFEHPKPAAAGSPRTPGVFQPTADQWRGLTLARVESRTFDEITVASGRIEADADLTTQVASPFTGRVIKVFAEAGQRVQAHAPLFSVAATEIVQGRSDLATALGALATAQAQLKLARETEQRQGELYRTAGGALKDWRQAQSDAVAAEGQVRAADAALGSARSRLAVLGQSERQVGALERVEASRAVDAQATVSAPVAGVVIKRNLGPGQTLTAGGEAVFAISDLSRVWLTAEAPESDTAKVRVGAQVQVSTPAYPGRVFRATVTYVAPVLDPDTHRLPVRAVIENGDGALKPDMFARFRIDSGPAATSPAVPDSAVIHDGDSARVWVVGPDSALHLRPVNTGLAEDGMTQILAGLNPGDQVVAKGALFVDQAGQPD